MKKTQTLKKLFAIPLLTLISLFSISLQTKAQSCTVIINNFSGSKITETVFSDCGYAARLNVNFFTAQITEYEVEKSFSSTGPFTAIGGQIISPFSNTPIGYNYYWNDYHFCASAYYRIKFKYASGCYKYSLPIHVAY